MVSNSFVCICGVGWTGQRCEISMSCAEMLFVTSGMLVPRARDFLVKGSRALGTKISPLCYSVAMVSPRELVPCVVVFQLCRRLPNLAVVSNFQE